MAFLNRRSHIMAVALAAMGLCFSSGTFAQNAPGAVRTVLTRHDTTAPGFEAVLVQVDIPVGGREGRHTHPCVALGYVAQGTLTLEQEGRPATDYKTGDSFLLEPDKIHEGVNKGSVPVKVLATFVVKKGDTLTTPAK